LEVDEVIIKKGEKKAETKLDNRDNKINEYARPRKFKFQRAGVHGVSDLESDEDDLPTIIKKCDDLPRHRIAGKIIEIRSVL